MESILSFKYIKQNCTTRWQWENRLRQCLFSEWSVLVIIMLSIHIYLMQDIQSQWNQACKASLELRGKACLPIYGLATLRSSIQLERFHFFCEEKDDWYSQVNRLFMSSCLHLWCLCKDQSIVNKDIQYTTKKGLRGKKIWSPWKSYLRGSYAV